jgi:hypothetical protein
MKISRRELRKLVEAAIEYPNSVQDILLDKFVDGTASAEDLETEYETAGAPDGLELQAVLDDMESDGKITRHEDGAYIKAEVRKLGANELISIIQEERSRMLSEDGHVDVSSATRSLMLAIESANDMLAELMHMGHGDHLPSWWMKKVYLASDYLETARNYLAFSPEEAAQHKDPVGGHVDFTGDVNDLDGDEAFGLGHEAGKQGLV